MKCIFWNHQSFILSNLKLKLLALNLKEEKTNDESFNFNSISNSINKFNALRTRN